MQFNRDLMHVLQIQSFRVAFEYTATGENGKSFDNFFKRGGVACTVERDGLTVSACRDDPSMAMRQALEEYTRKLLEKEVQKRAPVESKEQEEEEGNGDETV